MNKKVFGLVLSLFLLTSSSSIFAVEKLKGLKALKAQPVELKALTPHTDEGDGGADLYADIQRDVYNQDTLPISTNSWKTDYTVGRRLYQRGDYQRAKMAFETALLELQGFDKTDPRYKMTAKALDMASQLVSERGKLGYDTSNKNKNALTGKVTRVFAPSLAWLSGLRQGDRILRARTSKGVFRLTVSRKGKIRTLRLKAGHPRMAPTASSKLKGKAKATTLSGKTSETKVFPRSEKILADYDCCLLVDCSGSMNSKMAIGTGYEDHTRWSWCGDQSYNFLSNARKYLPNGITVVPFNSQFSIRDNVSLNDISDLYATVSPGGNTNIESPLSYVLARYFAKRARGYKKPFSVTILTDGIADVSDIGNVIIEATQKMSRKRDVVITFLEVDEAYAGEETLRALDTQLVAAGAKYDIVHVRSFHQLLDAGLKQSIVSTLIEAQNKY